MANGPWCCPASLPRFAGSAGLVLGDINHVHPFREGNGRMQLQYLKQLAARAGHFLDLTRLDRAAWLDASRAFSNGTAKVEVRIGADQA